MQQRNEDLYFIAEIGQNHNGSLETAFKMVDALKNIGGINAIKTVKRDIDTCLTDKQKQMIYDNPNSFGRTYYEHRKALEFYPEDFLKLKRYIEAAGFDFIASFTDKKSLDFLVNIGCKTLKIASQRAADYDLLNKVAKTKLPVIYSTGMTDWDIIDTAVEILQAYPLTIMQCTSVYPCPEKSLHLNVIPAIKGRYGCQVGFSGHHIGIAPDIVAFTLGANVFERHFTLSRAMKGTDHAASLEPSGIEKWVRYIGQAKESLGNNEKFILPEEMPALKKLRG